MGTSNYLNQSVLGLLRKETGFSMSLCRKALNLHDSDINKIQEIAGPLTKITTAKIWLVKHGEYHGLERKHATTTKEKKMIHNIRNNFQNDANNLMVHLPTIEEKVASLLKPLKNIKNSQLAVEVYPQFRAKLPSFANLYKIRSKLKMEMHNYFNEEGFVNIDTPIFTQYIKDASEDTLYIETTDILKKKECPVDLTFGHPVYLSPSGLLPLQCFVSGLSKVYCLGTAFYNGDPSGKHLIEYQKVICEEAFLNGPAGLENIMGRVERFLKFLLQHMLENCTEELESFNTNLVERLEKVVSTTFPKITYSDAIEVLKNHHEEVHNPVKYGMTIYRSGEKVLTDYFEGNPYFITDYPVDMKPFYADSNANGNTVKTFSLILPQSSTVASGLIGEHDYLEISKKLELFDGKNYYLWWLKAQEWGCPPSGGFSLGVDRLIYFMIKDFQLRHITPFPRTQNHCKL